VKEQKVIIEEMKMIEDTPDELLTELFHAAYFPDHSLGRPIEGTEKTVSTFDRSTTADFHERNFVPGNLVVAAAGNVVNDELVEMVRRTFGAEAKGDQHSCDSAKPEVAAPILIERKGELEQAHLIIAAPWPS